MKRILVGFLSFPIFSLFSLEYGLDAKKEGITPLRRVQVFSQRGSGSNYVQTLIEQNFSLIGAPKDGFFGHKHYSPWFHLPAESFLGPRSSYTFEGSDDMLFVVVFRDPYDWLRSLNRAPWLAAPHLHNLVFNEFIRMPWMLDETEEEVRREAAYNPFLERDPVTGGLFQTPLELRIAKIRNMLRMKDRVKNIYYINYETVRDHPEQVVQEIAEFFGLTRYPEFNPVIYYKGHWPQGLYQRKQYDPISVEDLLYINNSLDWELEKSIHYNLVENPALLE